MSKSYKSYKREDALPNGGVLLSCFFLLKGKAFKERNTFDYSNIVIPSDSSLYPFTHSHFW